jgi:nitrate reductase gamma subunit
MSVNGKPAGRLSLYLLLVVVLTAFTLVILVLPYDTVYVQDRTYLHWFLAVIVVSVVVFTIGVVSNALLWMRGKGLVGTPESRLMYMSAKALSFAFSRRMARLVRVFVKEALYIAKLRDLSAFRWLAHLMLLGGFVLMLVLDIAVTVSMDVLGWQAMIASDGWAKLLVRDFAFEVAGLMMLVGIVMAMARRFVARPKQLKTEGADIATLSFLFLVVAGGFVLEGMGIAGAIPGHEANESYSFVGYAFSLLMPESAGDYYDQAWLVHGVMSALLIAYIPFSKLFHMVTAPVAIEFESLLEAEAGAR